MDNTLVSARVPRAKKERARGILESLGATTSDLINSAFDYVISKRELPNSQEGTMTETSQTDDARFDAFAAFVSQSTVAVEWPEEFDGDYKALMGKKRLQDYESLA